MLILISPAKSLDTESALPDVPISQPLFLPEAERLAVNLRRKSRKALMAMMDISPDLAALNAQRYQDWHTPFSLEHARPAGYTFNGEVYAGLDFPSLDAAAQARGQDQLRILSGLYGLLRPLDLMQAYRLEMGCKYQPPRHKDLVAYWQERLTKQLRSELAEADQPLTVNLASQEYARAVDFSKLPGTVIECQFLEDLGDKLAFRSFYGKKARGLMARFILSEGVDQAEGLKDFRSEGYQYNAKASSDERWVYSRKS